MSRGGVAGIVIALVAGLVVLVLVVLITVCLLKRRWKKTVADYDVL